MSLSINLKIIARISVYLLIVSCTQSAVEKYGCACASRTYTTAEVEGYRTGAAKNDLKALAQMEEYHMWRGSEQADDSAGKKREKKLERSYRVRRLALNDPVALEDEIDHLISGATYWRETGTADRERALIRATEYALRLPKWTPQIDVWDPKRREIGTLEYIERELRYVREFGDSYHMNRSMHEQRAEDLQKRLEN